MKMRHPDIDGGAPPAEVTEEAFAEVWSEKGWVRVEEDMPTTPPPLSPNTPLNPNLGGDV